MKSLLRCIGLITLATAFSSVSASPSLDLAALYETNTFPRDPSLFTDDTRVLRRALDKRKFSLVTENDVLMSYDYVIAGGGLAGLVLASRLSEDSSRSVLVLEAGMSGDEVKDRVDPPAGAYYTSIVGSDYDWKRPIEPQVNLNNRAGTRPRGKILGGSTAMNAMYLVRDNVIHTRTRAVNNSAICYTPTCAFDLTEPRLLWLSVNLTYTLPWMACSAAGGGHATNARLCQEWVKSWRQTAFD